MSTRATYRLPLSHRGAATFYIHHDGHPEGAAFYLWHAHHCSCKGGLADQFIRANEQAELTLSHDQHGDTDFRYDVDCDLDIKAYRRERDPDHWQVFYIGHYTSFINEHCGGIEDFQAIRPVMLTYHKRPMYVTMRQLEERLQRRIFELEKYRAAFPDMVGNISSLEDQVEGVREAIEQYNRQATAGV